MRSHYSDCGEMKGFLDLDHMDIFTHIDFLFVFYYFDTVLAILAILWQLLFSRSLIFTQVYEITSCATVLGIFMLDSV